MKLICTQENLRRAIAVAERAVGRQGTLPILGNLLLETEHGRLKVSATNLEIGVVARVGAKVETEGKITVSAKLLGNFVANLPAGETVALEAEGTTLLVMAGRYRVRIKGLDAQEFPIIPQSKDGATLDLPAQDLKAALGRLLPCVALNEARVELTGVNMLFSDAQVCLAATDSFRLAEEEVALDPAADRSGVGAFVEQGPRVVPSATLAELVRAITPESRRVRVISEESQLFFEVDGVEIISRLVSGRFPDYRQIIPTEFGSRVFVDRESLLRAVRIASVFMSQGLQEIVFHVRPGERQLLVESRSQEVGENQTAIEADIEGAEDIDLIFNPRYIVDGLNAVMTPTVALLANGDSSPVVLRMTDDGHALRPGFVYVVMPVRN